jgi:hypothetical protein
VSVAVMSRGDEAPAGEAIPTAQIREMTDVCEAAGRDKLDPLVTETGAETRWERVDGTDWKIRTSLNHKTNWSDNWYDVSCVVAWTSPTAKVKAVETARREDG